jgi:hypothetical protein
MALVGREWIRNQRGIQLPLFRTHAAVPVKIGGTYTTSHPEDDWALVHDYEGVVTMNGKAFGKAGAVGVPYKLANYDDSIPDDHDCRLPQTCNPPGSSGLCLPAGGGFGYNPISAHHLECLCRWGDCCEEGKRCFTASGELRQRRLALATSFKEESDEEGSTASTGGVVGGVIGVLAIAGVVACLHWGDLRVRKETSAEDVAGGWLMRNPSRNSQV